MAKFTVLGKTYEAKDMDAAILMAYEARNGGGAVDLSTVPAPNVHAHVNQGGGMAVSGTGIGSINIVDRELASFLLNPMEVARRIAAVIVDTNAEGIGRAHKHDTPADVTKRRATVLAAARKVMADLAAEDTGAVAQ